jgi:hypothetical protein
MWAWVKKKRQEWRIDCVDFLFKVFLLICINSMVQ